MDCGFNSVIDALFWLYQVGMINRVSADCLNAHLWYVPTSEEDFRLYSTFVFLLSYAGSNYATVSFSFQVF